ncbi:hypothetical protein GCM10027446_08170 [Angustibacter peucedani]
MGRLSPQAREQVDGLGSPVPLTVDGVPAGLDVEVAASLRQRTVGLLGAHTAPTTALLLHPCSSVHSIGMRVDLEVAYLDSDLEVLEVTDLPRWRMHRPRRRAVAVLEAAPGALTAAGLRPGVRLGVVRA